MLRACLVMMFVLCALCGLYLLVFAPEFFMPVRDDLRQFGPLAARTLGAALTVIALLAFIFLRHQYAKVRRYPSPAVQAIYFALIVLALVLLNLSLNQAEPVPAPPAQSTPPNPYQLESRANKIDFDVPDSRKFPRHPASTTVA